MAKPAVRVSMDLECSVVEPARYMDKSMSLNESYGVQGGWFADRQRFTRARNVLRSHQYPIIAAVAAMLGS